MASAQVPESAPRQPSGPWKVEYGDEMCLLSRSFGTAADAAILGFRTGLSDEVATVFFARPSANDTGRTRAGKVFLSPGAGPVAVQRDYESQFSAGAKLRVETFYVDVSTLEVAETTGRLSIRFDTQPAQVFAVPNLMKALAALQTCEERLMAKWGMDMAARARAVQPAKFIGEPAFLFGADNYPPDARRAGESGRAVALLEVAADGKITGCRIAVSSKSRSLDAATCAIPMRRLKLEPARDASGAAISSQKWLAINWRLG